MYKRFHINWALTSSLMEGLRFRDLGGPFLNMKAPLISQQLTSNKAFKRGSSFYSSSWVCATKVPGKQPGHLNF